MKIPRRSALLASLLACVAGCTAKTVPPAPVPFAVREIPGPAAPGSGEANLAVGPRGEVLLSWIERLGEKRHALRFASRPAGGAWSQPQTIAEGGDWFVNWADFPSMAALPDGTLFAHWLAKSGSGTYAYDVRIATSRDQGRTWTEGVVPHRDGTQTEHGFVSMTPWSATEMGVIWLDGRNTAGAAHGAGAAHDAAAKGGAMSLAHSTLGADSRLGPEAILDTRVCDCCQTDVARAEDATVVVYRDRSEGEVRDMSVVRFADGKWSAPVPLANDGWQISGCPVNGPAIAAEGRNVMAAWFTAANGTARVKLALSSDAGATFGQPITVDDGRPLGRVDVVALEGGAALVSWLEQTDDGASLRVRRVSRDGSAGKAEIVSASSKARSSGFPRMVQAGKETLIAWRDTAEPSTVRTAVLTIGMPGSD